MIALGTMNRLPVVKKVEFGVYLGEEAEKVLLPSKKVPEGTAVGDSIDVFVYRDSKDRLIATTDKPLIQLGNLARLTVKDVNKVGAFLDWGLEKDLFIPYKEQTYKVSVGDTILVGCYIDKSDRLCATMKIYDYLLTEAPYDKDDEVKGYLYNINPQFGAFVAVDDKYNGMIPKVELGAFLKVGDDITGRVVKKRSDGKLDISVRDKAYIQMNKDADYIYSLITKNGGRLDFNDKASPELIREKVGMTKNQFKRAIGHLLKEGKVRIDGDFVQGTGK